jgi:hypothetical protein
MLSARMCFSIWRRYVRAGRTRLGGALAFGCAPAGATESTGCSAASPAAARSTDVSLPSPCPITTPATVSRRPPAVTGCSFGLAAGWASPGTYAACPRRGHLSGDRQVLSLSLSRWGLSRTPWQRVAGRDRRGRRRARSIGYGGLPFVLVRCRRCLQSTQRGAASTYVVFDMPSICSGP